MNTLHLSSNEIDQAVSILKQGGIVAVPTETVYGLAANAEDDVAVTKIFQAKGRPADHPLIVHVDSLNMAEAWVTEIPDEAIVLAEAFWPGPLTLILNKKPHIGQCATSQGKTVAVRIPNHPVTLSLIQKLGKGIAAPSANPYQKVSPTTAQHVLSGMNGIIDAVLDGGACSVGLESTILDLSNEIPRILRPGAVSAEIISDHLDQHVEQPRVHQEKIPGNMNCHYRPNAPLLLLERSEIKKYLTIHSDKKIAVVLYDNEVMNKTHVYQLPNNPQEYAQKLYETLHKINHTDVNQILVQKVPVHYSWSHIQDRLQKASSNFN